MGTDKYHWLELLIPPFRRTIARMQSLGQQVKVLEDTNQELHEQVDQQAAITLALQQQIDREIRVNVELQEQIAKQAPVQERLSKQQAVIEKLTKRLEAVQLERDEVYKQYNSLLGHMSGPEISTFRPYALDPSKMGEEYAPTLVRDKGWRLNIGCGRVKKAGYLNVDVDPSVKPDLVVALDLSLPFASGTFELIEAYHVIEHVYPWVRLNILKELWRILKPQGKIAIECPNIESACAWLIQNPEYGPDSQMGMWALYGDPNPENPLQMHKWGYTPITLGRILRQAGFVGIQREVPETHVPARDFRMTAVKPVEVKS